MTNMSYMEYIRKRLLESAELKKKSAELLPAFIEMAVKEIVKRLRKGGKVLTCGNGGSACDAQHIVGELVVRFYKDRPPIPAIALETNPAVITASGNDYSYAESFARSAQALINKNDALIAISTSGNSANILRVIDIAKRKGAWILGLSGKTGGKMKAKCNQIILVPSDDTPRIQEVHIAIAHILCELIEKELYR